METRRRAEESNRSRQRPHKRPRNNSVEFERRSTSVPGWLRFGTETARPLFTSTDPRFASCLDDHTVGAIRVSMGLGTVRADIDRFQTLLARYAEVVAAA
jgi:hypothetical protein